MGGESRIEGCLLIELNEPLPRNAPSLGLNALAAWYTAVR